MSGDARESRLVAYTKPNAWPFAHEADPNRPPLALGRKADGPKVRQYLARRPPLGASLRARQ